MEDKTNLDKIPTDIKYYLLGWKDRNMEDYINTFGEVRLRDLTLKQLRDLFAYAVSVDYGVLSNIR